MTRIVLQNFTLWCSDLFADFWGGIVGKSVGFRGPFPSLNVAWSNWYLFLFCPPIPDYSHTTFLHTRSDPAGPTQSWVRVRWGFLGFAYEQGWMGATCQHDWQVGLMLINFNGSCQGTPGAPTWRVSPTDTFGHAHRHTYKHIHTHLCVTSLWSCTSKVFILKKRKKKREWMSLTDRLPWPWALIWPLPLGDTDIQHIRPN